MFVDDDEFYSLRYVAALRDHGLQVTFVETAELALKHIDTRALDLLIVDMMMTPAAGTSLESSGGFHTGLLIARRARDRYPHLPVIGLSFDGSSAGDAFWYGHKSLFLTKSSTGPVQLARHACRMLGLPRSRARIFIVHGRDMDTVRELTGLLRRRLKVEPVVAVDEASAGRTIIEQIEFFAPTVDAVCVLLTGDDRGNLVEARGTQRRARINVMFELGYFLGLMKRSSGRVVVLRKGELDVGSDLSGLIYIDITQGLEAAVKRMRSELKDIL